jgi:hypothetical protein
MFITIVLNGRMTELCTDKDVEGSSYAIIEHTAPAFAWRD